MGHWRLPTTLWVAAVVALRLSAQVQAADIHIGLNLGIPLPPPPPPVVVTTVPQLVVVPGTSVYYAPDVPHNFFFYSQRYYVLHNDSWFYASSHNGPWTFIGREKVPSPVLAVPVRYYRGPPGHAKDKGGPPPWAGHGTGHGDHKHKGKHDR
jgi:hypothetical protein